jgi:hypothetical protein
VTGNRIARLFCPSKKNKCHALHVFAVSVWEVCVVRFELPWADGA